MLNVAYRQVQYYFEIKKLFCYNYLERGRKREIGTVKSRYFAP